MAHDSARILVIDDNPAIHDVFSKLLTPPRSEDDELDTLEAELFGTSSSPRHKAALSFQIDGSNQGELAAERVARAVAADRPYALAFVDMRMPPGWDGVRTMHELWRRDDDLEIVLCTAYADRDWHTILRDIAQPERLLVLKKPFDGIEVVQMAQALCLKWLRRRALTQSVRALERRLEQQRAELERTRSELTRMGSSRRRATS